MDWRSVECEAVKMNMKTDAMKLKINNRISENNRKHEAEKTLIKGPITC